MKQKFFIVIALLIGIVTMLILLLIPKQNNFATEELAKHFYSFYHESISRDKTPEEVASFLEQYTVNGFSTTLEEAMKLLTVDEQLKITQAQSCDVKASRFTFYPHIPYEANDYKYKIEMVCP